VKGPGSGRSACALGAAFVLAATGACRGPLTSVGEYRERSDSEDAGYAVEAGRPTPDARVTGFYLEAEQGQLADGYSVESEATTSAGAYILPPSDVQSRDAPGIARAVYTVNVAESGVYVFWGRIHSPDASHNAVWFRIDEGSWYVWRLSTGEDWFWAPFHDDLAYGNTLRFELSAGEHTLRVANYDDRVGLDRFYVAPGTGGGDEAPPGNDTPCNPPHSIRLGGECIPSCGSRGGNACGVQDCAGLTPIVAYDCDVCCIDP